MGTVFSSPASAQTPSSPILVPPPTPIARLNANKVVAPPSPLVLSPNNARKTNANVRRNANVRKPVNTAPPATPQSAVPQPAAPQPMAGGRRRKNRATKRKSRRSRK
jgi:hypothetical protein